MSAERDLERLEARWRVGHILTSELPAVADSLLASGLDAPTLRELAGIHSDDVGRETRQTFETVLRELGRGRMTASEAALILARVFSEQVLAGRLEPPAAARAIALLRWKGGPDVDEHIVPFELLDEKYEGLHVRRLSAFFVRRRLDRAVEKEARKLLGG